MSLVSNFLSFVTRVGTEFKSVRTQAFGSATGDASTLQTTSKNLLGAINELYSRPAGGGTLDSLSDAAVTAPAIGDVLRYDATNNFVNVPGNTYFQPRDSDLDAIAALSTTSFGRSLLATADQIAFTALVNDATTTTGGKVRFATTAEAATGTATDRVLSPATGAATYQPLDSDLSAIAALTTTPFGRSLLSTASATALTALLDVGTTTTAGKLQLATNAEAQAGTDTAKATTSAGTKAAIDQRIDNTAGLTSNSTTNAPSVAASKAYADGLLDANNGLQFKGAIDASTNPNFPAANAGWQYKISVAGKIGGAAGQVVEVNDTLYCTVDSTASGTQAAVGANWVITQTNIDGAVIGPVTSVGGNLASFSGSTGKVIADSGFAVSSGAVSGNSTTAVPTQSAVVSYAQPVDVELTALAGLVSAADRLPYFTGSGTASLATLTTFARTLIDDVDAPTARATLGLGTAATQNSTAFQASDGTLTALAGLTTAADQMIYSTGVDAFAMTTLSSFIRTLLDDVDAPTARSTLGVYSTVEIGDVTTDFVAAFNAALV